MAKDSENLLIAISALANHGKTRTGKQLIRALVSDAAFNRLCPYYKVWKLGKRKDPVPDLSKDGLGDWVALFSDKAECVTPVVAVITRGDYWSPILEETYENTFSFGSVKIIVGACRPDNSVHKHLLSLAREHTFSMVETSPCIVSLNNSNKTEETIYQEWNNRGACQLKETVKEALHLTDRVKLSGLHTQLRSEQALGRLAFLLGNGINKYATDGECPSWNDLIKELWKNISSNHGYQTADEGYSLIEQYDILRNRQNPDATDADITKRVQELVSKYFPGDEDYYEFLHKRLENISVPVLTTNFDTNLESEFGRYATSTNGSKGKDTLISEIYHWNEYYAKEPISEEDIGRSFSVWHVHGNVNQKKTIRLDLSAYMAQVTYTRNFLRDVAHLWAVEKEGDPWGVETRISKEPAKGYAFTWLNIFYNFSICINGLGLSKDETYLRWLLISRYKYQKRIGIKQKGWYIYGPGDNVTEGMKSFLRGVGFEPVMIEDFTMRYEELFCF